MKIMQVQGRGFSCQVLLFTNRCLQREKIKPSKQTPPSSFPAREEGAAEDEDNQTLGFTETTLSPIMAVEEKE
jgi:hypothetical protein